MAPERSAIRSANADANASGPNRLVSNSSRKPALLISTPTSGAARMRRLRMRRR